MHLNQCHESILLKHIMHILHLVSRWIIQHCRFYNIIAIGFFNIWQPICFQLFCLSWIQAYGSGQLTSNISLFALLYKSNADCNLGSVIFGNATFCLFCFITPHMHILYFISSNHLSRMLNLCLELSTTHAASILCSKCKTSD